MSMKIGQTVTVYPTHMRERQKKCVAAVVVYIHPEGRFFTAEWVVHGDVKMRESFGIGNRRLSETYFRKKQ